MSDTVIRVNDLAKRYRIGVRKKKGQTFTEEMLRLIKSPIENFRRVTNLSRFNENDESVFWALRDVNFDVQQGDVLGIIGHNGAGKSTLLKILSRITDPTKGSIEIKGRVSSLLEVGTGFHQELTGRENIFMNGTILGMRKREIDAKLDEIIAFSGVEKHIDTPVKFYSSGMKVRLGFSVAAHLEPEILIIDEVLAVGDLEFQRKCLGKMEDVSQSGRTVLFVSHSMASIKQLCTKCFVMHKGTVAFQGNVEDGIQAYISQNLNSSLTSYFKKSSVENGVIELIEGEVVDENERNKSQFNADEDVYIKLLLNKNQLIPGIQGYLVIRSESDEAYIESDTFDFLPNVLDQLEIGQHHLLLRIEKRVLPKGRFKVYINFASSFSANKGHNLDSPKDILQFEVYDTTSRRGANRKAYTNSIVQWKKIS